MKKLMQKILDTAYAGIVEQGGPAMDGDNCMYRAPSGRRCAIGHNIQDWKYRKWFEGQTVLGVGEKLFGQRMDDNEFRSFVCELQKAHDNHGMMGLSDKSFLRQWKLACKRIAKNYKLEVPVNAN